MPTDEEKKTVELSEEASGESTEKKGSKKTLLFGAIGVACLLVGVVLAIFVVRPMLAGSKDAGTADQTSQVEPAKVADHGKDAKRYDKSKAKKKSDHGTAASVVYAIKDIVVNPAGTGGSRFLSVSFGFELESPDLAHEFESREIVVRDALITILSSKTVTQLTDARQKEIMRYQIKKRISRLLETDELAAVYYTDFVLQ